MSQNDVLLSFLWFFFYLPTQLTSFQIAESPYWYIGFNNTYWAVLKLGQHFVLIYHNYFTQTVIMFPLNFQSNTAHIREKSSRLRHCNKAFAYKSQLLTHERTHNEKSYSCSHLNMSFVGKDNDLSHNKTQQPYSCSHCSKGFAHKFHLTSWERPHWGETIQLQLLQQGFNQERISRKSWENPHWGKAKQL